MGSDGGAAAATPAAEPWDRDRLLQDLLSSGRRLRDAEERFRLLLETMPGVAYIAEPGTGGSWHYVSPRLRDVLGWDPQEWVDDPSAWARLLHPDDRARVLAEEAEWGAADAQGVANEYRLRHRDGSWVWVRDAAVPRVSDVSGATVWFGVLSDVSERVRLQEELHALAYGDPLTGLANRAALRRRVEERYADGTARRLALLLVDVDGFAALNDLYGHEAADEVLVVVGERLRASQPDAELVARLDADRFAVLLDRHDEAGLAGRCEQVAHALADPVRVRAGHRRLRVSTGAAGAWLRAARPADLVRNADAALAAAKRAGGGTWRLYDPSAHARALQRASLQADLERAVVDGQLLIHLQPVVSLPAGALVGFESLVRWRHPERGLVPPGDFVPLAEATGRIAEIGEWVLRRACTVAQSWPTDPAGGPWVSVNVSAVQAQDDSLADVVAGALRDTGLDPRRLVLEITESVLVGDVAATAATLRRVRGTGVRVALDDFGTGFSSLSYLHHLPLDLLKIDKSFLAQLGDGSGPSTAEVVVALGHTLGLTLVGEGVESAEQATLLAALGCQLAQGYHFGRPLDEDTAGLLVAGDP